MRSRGNLNLGGLPPSQGSSRQNRQPKSATIGVCMISRPIKAAWRFIVKLASLKHFGLALWVTEPYLSHNTSNRAD